MSSPRYTRLLAALDRLPDAVGGKRADKPAAKILVAEIRRTHRRMRRRLDDALAADGTEADARLHEVRKAAKRVRYAAESATGVLGAGPTSWLPGWKQRKTRSGPIRTRW